MVLIITSDNVEYKFDDKYLNKSQLLYNIYKYTIIEEPIPVLLTYDIFHKIYLFMTIDTSQLERDYNPLTIKFKQSDFEYFKDVDYNTLIEISNGCNYLEYYYCLEICCKMIADRWKYKSVNQLKSQMEETGNKPENKDFNWIESDNE